MKAPSRRCPEDSVIWVARDITERKRAEAALEQQVEREAVINRISRAVRRSLDTTVVFHTAVQELGSYLGVDRCSLFMIEMRRSGACGWWPSITRPASPAAGRDFPLSQAQESRGQPSSARACWSSTTSPATPGSAQFYNEVLQAAGVRSIMYVAIKMGEEMPAVFAFSTTRNLRHWRESKTSLWPARSQIRRASRFVRRSFPEGRGDFGARSPHQPAEPCHPRSLSLPEVLSTATRELGRALNASRVHLYMYDPQQPARPRRARIRRARTLRASATSR